MPWVELSQETGRRALVEVFRRSVANSLREKASDLKASVRRRKHDEKRARSDVVRSMAMEAIAMDMSPSNASLTRNARNLRDRIRREKRLRLILREATAECTSRIDAILHQHSRHKAFSKLRADDVTVLLSLPIVRKDIRWAFGCCLQALQRCLAPVERENTRSLH